MKKKVFLKYQYDEHRKRKRHRGWRTVYSIDQCKVKEYWFCNYSIIISVKDRIKSKAGKHVTRLQQFWLDLRKLWIIYNCLCVRYCVIKINDICAKFLLVVVLLGPGFSDIIVQDKIKLLIAKFADILYEMFNFN